MSKKRALITGVTGQDGAYLAKFLSDKNYEVHGLIRRSASPNYERLNILRPNITLHEGDLSDSGSILRIIETTRPDEIYNLAAQSNVGSSFKVPEYTADVSGIGTLRILETLRTLKIEKKTRFYQASTSELYGKVQSIPQDESTPFYPRSPYASAKLFAYWTTVNYRESYGIYACNGILFNHESPLRGEDFVTRKITKSLAEIAAGKRDILCLGNLDVLRDWGHAKDYVEMQWLMLQQEKPEDFVIATGKQYSVRDFIDAAAQKLGIEISWRGEGLNETGIVSKINGQSQFNEKLSVGQKIIQVDPAFFRPAEVETLLGSPAKAKRLLGWEPKTSFEDLVGEMVAFDLERAFSSLEPLLPLV